MEDSDEVQDEHTQRRNDGIENNEIEMSSVNSSTNHLAERSQQLQAQETMVQIDEDISQEFENSSEFIRAVLSGNKEKALAMFKENPKEIVETRIGQNGETALHMAIEAAKEKRVATIVDALLNLDEMKSEYLAIGTMYDTNALHYAAISGNLEIATKIHENNVHLVNMTNNEKSKPIYLAALAGHSDLIKYFLRHTKFDSDDRQGSTVLNECISGGLYGLAVELVKKHSPSAITKDEDDETGETALQVLARIPSPVTQDCSIAAFWRNLVRSKESSTKLVNRLLDQIWPIWKKSDLYKTSYLRNLLLTAAENGNYEFLVYLLDHYPGLVHTRNDKAHTIFHIAILHRYEKIFTLIYEIGPLKEFFATMEDNEDNSMLHLAALLSPQDQLNRIHGAALQMQRELLWYKKVEKIVPPAFAKLPNRAGKTPHDIFISKHRKLMQDGEEWMKRTTQFSMVVSALIATVVFTTAFTIPGGINNYGAPNFARTNFFDMFVVSEIVAMIFSSISLVMYLCILTSRYAEKDFLKSLPFWLTIGTTSLFISLTSMLVAFCSAFLVFRRYDKEYVPILLGFLAVAPVMFIWFKYPLFVDIVKTTTSSKSLSRSRKKLFPGKAGVAANCSNVHFKDYD